MNPNRIGTVCVPGGGGYVGAVLVPRLLDLGYRVKVLDLFIYGEHVLPKHTALETIKGDIRDLQAVARAVADCDAAIHLACISNDPSVELNPDLSRTINFESFGPFVRASKSAGVRRFIFASSGSVYGISDAPQVTEDHPLIPITLYNQYKAKCESLLLAEQAGDFATVIIRPATLCGYSPRQRLDLTINILTNLAVKAGKITVFGGKQTRPNLHIQDMVDLYTLLLELPDKQIAGKIYNAGYQNLTVADAAQLVKRIVGRDVEIVTTPSDDIRSYRVNSDKIQRELGFVPKHTIEDAVRGLLAAFDKGLLPDSLTDSRYFNVKLMKEIQLT